MGKDYHSEGQKDSAGGKYDPPHSSWVDTVNETVDSSIFDRHQADRDAYESGRDNDQAQGK